MTGYDMGGYDGSTPASQPLSGPVACRSGHDDCTTDCGWCKGSGIDLARTRQAEAEQVEPMTWPRAFAIWEDKPEQAVHLDSGPRGLNDPLCGAPVSRCVSDIDDVTCDACLERHEEITSEPEHVFDARGWQPGTTEGEPTRAVPVARVRALVALLFPEEITPHAKRLIERVCEEYE